MRDLFCRLWDGENGPFPANLGRLGVRGRSLYGLAMDAVVDVCTVHGDGDGERGILIFLSCIEIEKFGQS